MKHWKLLLGATAAVATLAACGGGYGQGAGNAAPAANGAVSVQDVNGVGKALVDSAGKTLYFADQEADGAIKCTAGCLNFWFPVEGSDSTAKSMEGLAVVKRSDTGKSQLTYQGKPLYTFKLDTGPGQHQGNNVTDDFSGTTFRWHAATTTATAPSPAPSSAGNGYGNGY
jgi:predicted lipoprotein with Yx(FWY)xxD motif